MRLRLQYKRRLQDRMSHRAVMVEASMMICRRMWIGLQSNLGT